MERAVYQFGKHLIPGSNVFLTSTLSYAFTNRKPVLPGRILVSGVVNLIWRWSEVTYHNMSHLLTISDIVVLNKQVFPLTIMSDVLVSPVRPVKRFADLTHNEVSDLFICVHRIGPVLQEVYSSTALTIVVQDGKDAGQTVEHVHVHILPRKHGDFKNNDDIYEKVSGVWHSAKQGYTRLYAFNIHI